MVQPKDHSLQSQAHLIPWLSCTYSQVSWSLVVPRILHLFMFKHLPIHYSFLRFIYPSFCLFSTHPYFLLNRSQPITEKDILPSISPCINPCLSSIHLSTHPSICPSFLTYNHPLTNSSVLFSLLPSIYPPIPTLNRMPIRFQEFLYLFYFILMIIFYSKFSKSI